MSRTDVSLIFLQHTNKQTNNKLKLNEKTTILLVLKLEVLLLELGEAGETLDLSIGPVKRHAVVGVELHLERLLVSPGGEGVEDSPNELLGVASEGVVDLTVRVRIWKGFWHRLVEDLLELRKSLDLHHGSLDFLQVLELEAHVTSLVRDNAVKS